MRGVVYLFLFLLMCSVASAVVVDNGVISTLNTKDSARVIITYDGNVPLPDDVISAPDIKTFYGELSRKEILDLSNNPNVKSIQLDWKLSVTREDGWDIINADVLNAMVINGTNLTGQGQTICILDTGIDYSHEEFGNCTFLDLVNNTCPSIVYGYDYVNNDNNPFDDDGHGTHVAGIAKIVAPDAKFVIMKVCDENGDCYISDMISAVSFCDTWRDLYNISVITMSIGDEGDWKDDNCFPSDPLARAINLAHSHNLFITAASGNEGYSTGINYPGCIGGSTSVGATTDSDQIASFSNTYTTLDILAPGSAISSTLPGGYGVKSGTSMATPFAAASGALLIQYAELTGLDLTPLQVETKLKVGGVSIDSWKRIDLNASLFAGYECFRASDCGTDIWVGDATCNNSTFVYQNKTVFSCTQGYCSNQTSLTLKESCTNGCQDGTCLAVTSRSGGGGSLKSDVHEVKLEVNNEWNLGDAVEIRVILVDRNGEFESVDVVRAILTNDITGEIEVLGEAILEEEVYVITYTPDLAQGTYTLRVTAEEGYASEFAEKQVEIVKLSPLLSVSSLGFDRENIPEGNYLARFIDWILGLKWQS